MESLWKDEEAAGYQDELGLRVYTSRLLGRDPALVLHGGGNTSVKIREKNVVGQEEEILYVKGSGWDLESIDRPGFAPVRMAHLLALARLAALPDPVMVNELKTHCTLASAPAPSVEAILHAVLPYRYVDHTHADAVVAVTNTADGEARIREIYGEAVVLIPYVMPGFDLARECARRFAAESGPATVGMVLMNHGIFSFGDTAREAYERMVALVTRAEEYLGRQGALELPACKPAPLAARRREDLAWLRKEVSDAAGFPMLLTGREGDAADAFCQRADLGSIASRGPATPDHVLRTKRLPLLGRDVAAYGEAYRAYFRENARNAREPKTMLDPAPRVILDPALGLLTVGRSAKDASIVADIYDHTMDIILRAERLGGYRALPARDIFDVEYWDLEQAKLKKGGKPAVFAGEVALVTGAASGIGRACVEAFLARGAAVVGLDRSEAVTGIFRRPDYLGLCCDVTDGEAVDRAFEATARRFGGLDMLVANAGIFPAGKRIAELDDALWRKVLAVNLDANLALLRQAHPLLSTAPRHGRVVVIGSKNVPAPGVGAAAYSASKAALTQMARIAALEWGEEGIRVNVLHPDAVFDTGVWTEEVLASRARHYGMTVEQYKRRNILKTEVASRDVAELAAELCGPVFAKTTGAQIPVDGGNDRVI